MVIVYGHCDHGSLLMTWADDVGMMSVVNSLITQYKISVQINADRPPSATTYSRYPKQQNHCIQPIVAGMTIVLPWSWLLERGALPRSSNSPGWNCIFSMYKSTWLVLKFILIPIPTYASENAVLHCFHLPIWPARSLMEPPWWCRWPLAMVGFHRWRWIAATNLYQLCTIWTALTTAIQQYRVV